jgi:hypothetical protein
MKRGSKMVTKRQREALEREAAFNRALRSMSEEDRQRVLELAEVLALCEEAGRIGAKIMRVIGGLLEDAMQSVTIRPDSEDHLNACEMCGKLYCDGGCDGA